MDYTKVARETIIKGINKLIMNIRLEIPQHGDDYFQSELESADLIEKAN